MAVNATTLFLGLRDVELDLGLIVYIRYSSNLLKGGVSLFLLSEPSEIPAGLQPHRLPRTGIKFIKA